jgi:hypothetical protein
MLTIKEHTPIGVLRAIRARYPNVNGEQLLRTFEAYVYDDAELCRTVIRHAFASALSGISAQPPEPSSA